MKKQTAVEWLISQLYEYPFDDIIMRRLKTAIEMEKEQIEDAFEYGWSARNAESMKYGKQYYNETFNP